MEAVTKGQHLANETFIPSFKKYPEFHYANASLFGSDQSVSSYKSLDDSLIGRKPTDLLTKSESSSNFVTIKIRTNLDEDFVEIDLDRLHTSFETFKEICLNEFVDYVSIDFSVMRLEKIRKLPDVLIRNTNDVKRLKENQSVEFFFVNKNKSNLI